MECECPRLHAPIVLAHGLFGFVRIGLGPWTLATYFRGIPDFLRRSGNRVLLSRVHPTADVARRAWKLKQRIDAAFPGEAVHIIGHSMGGLDARELLADPMWKSRVLSLTTIGTPHLGSPLADSASVRLKAVYRTLERIGLNHGGFYHLQRLCARTWHESTTPPDGVPCFSVAGDIPFERVSRPLRALHQMIEAAEGPNDGLVSVSSAEAFGVALPLWPTDHFHQMNWGTPPVPVLGLYAEVVANIARLGFGDATPGIDDAYMRDPFEVPVGSTSLG